MVSVTGIETHQTKWLYTGWFLLFRSQRLRASNARLACVCVGEDLGQATDEGAHARLALWRGGRTAPWGGGRNGLGGLAGLVCCWAVGYLQTWTQPVYLVLAVSGR